MLRAVRLTGQVTLAAGLAGTVVVLAAAPALATAGKSPKLSVANGCGGSALADGATVNSNAVLCVTGSDSAPSIVAGSSRTLQLTVTLADSNNGPASYKLAADKTVAATQGGSISGQLDTTNAPWSGQDAANGRYTFAFGDGGSTTTTSTLTLLIPPARVSGFGGAANGTVAHFTWSANSEPDIAGYDIIDTTGSSARDLTPGGVDTSVCNGNACAVDIDFGSSAAGTSRSFVIDALRYTSPAQSATVSSADSSPVTVNFPAAATPSSNPSAGGSSGGNAAGSGSGSGSGSGGGSSGSHGGASGAGGSTAGGSVSTSAGGGSSRPTALRAYLPGTTIAGAAPNLPSVVTEVKPLPQGTYQPTLAYPNQVVGSTVRHPVSAAQPTQTALAHVLDASALWKSLAGAALILLVAGHLRSWSESVDPFEG